MSLCSGVDDSHEHDRAVPESLAFRSESLVHDRRPKIEYRHFGGRSGCGMLADFLLRQRGLSNVHSALQLLDGDPESSIGLGRETHQNALDIIQMETLVCRVNDLLNAASARKHIGGSCLFRKHGWQLIRDEKLFTALDAEVEILGARPRITRRTRKECEDLTQKTKRLASFWHKLHTHYKVTSAEKDQIFVPQLLGLEEDVEIPAEDLWKCRTASTRPMSGRPRKPCTLGASPPSTLRGGHVKNRYADSKSVQDRKSIAPERKSIVAERASIFMERKSQEWDSKLCSIKRSNSALARPGTSQSIHSPPTMVQASPWELSREVMGRPESQEQWLHASRAPNSPGSTQDQRFRPGSATPLSIISAFKVYADSSSKVTKTLPGGASPSPKKLQPAGCFLPPLGSPSGMGSLNSFGTTLGSTWPSIITSASAPDLMRSAREDKASTFPLQKGEKGAPWSDWGGVHAAHRATTPAKLYLKACEASYVVPNLIPFCTGDSSKLLAEGLGLQDPELTALTAMLATTEEVVEIDLKGGSMLTERSLIPFFDALRSSERLAKRLQLLNIRGCLRYASPPGLAQVVDGVVDIMNNIALKLRILDVSAIPMGMKCHLPLCRAVKAHKYMKQLSLSDIGLGANPMVTECLTLLLSSPSVETLDLSWNTFGEVAFTHLGKEVAERQTLTSLNVANCASSCGDNVSSADFFIEYLAADEDIIHLDLSNNRINFRGALILEAALLHHKTITELHVSHNPLSEIGFRSLFRLLGGQGCPLIRLGCEDCVGGNLAEVEAEHFQIFKMTNPSGKYVLHLERPYDRALLFMLYETCKRLKVPPQECFSSLRNLEGPAYVHPVDGACGALGLPHSGCIEFIFGMEAGLSKISNDVACSDFLNRHFEIFRVQPAFDKALPILEMWRRIRGFENEQMIMLDALAKDFRFNYLQLRHFCRSREIITQMASRLLPSLRGDNVARFKALLQIPTIIENVNIRVYAMRYSKANFDNPTGHYLLNLRNACDYAVAERMLLLDRWETALAAAHELVDVSARGCRSQIRNEMYEGVPLTSFRCIGEFLLREYGTLEFDYVSNFRPPEKAAAVKEDVFQAILTAIQTTSCSCVAKADALTLISHTFYVTSAQVRALMGRFRERAARYDAFVRCYFRIVDIWNEKIVRASFEHRDDFYSLQQRLGFLAFFPFIQPEQTDFVLDFSKHDQRLVVHLLLTYSIKESRTNVRDFTYTLADGTIDPLTMGIPRSWDALDKVPHSGVFRCSYQASASQIAFSERCLALNRLGFWSPPNLEDVKWWGSSAACSASMVDFVASFHHRKQDVETLFAELSEQGTRSVNLRVFEDGCADISLGKLDEKEKQNRLVSIFRSLDVGGDGLVTVEEWELLRRVLEDVRCCCRDFVALCERTHGVDLEDTWVAWGLSVEKTLDRRTFDMKCKDMGFSGLADPIFTYLDSDFQGRISLEKFASLSEFNSLKEVADFRSHRRGAMLARTLPVL